ncbi:MAG: nicotinate phosphoribosyltransferase [Chloroflexi bacterium]|nr:nicotinate phosphoribosyltransferase [Chloroflexota bacterium]
MLRSFVGYHPGLMTDLYHPDSAFVAWRKGRNNLATFDLYARRAPFGGAYILVAGIETALEFVREFRYTPDDLAFLAQVRDYDPRFLDELGRLRFTGEILAVPEGQVVFPGEPIMRVTAPFMEALLIESGLLQAVNLATLIATKASRVVHAAQKRRIAEFALRRAQEPFVVTRSSFVGGCYSTSFLAAAYKFRLLASGSIPHALVQFFESEREAFESVAETYNRYVLLLDTYDTRRAIHTAVDVAREYQERLGHTLAAVRLDSGDIVEDSRYVRAALDGAGLADVKILISGDMDEFRIVEILEQGAQVDGFGVGTSLGVGAGSVEHDVEGGALGGVYKLVAWQDADGRDQAVIKLAAAKTTWPGRKEVYRFGEFERDLIQLADEPRPAGAARLLKPVVRQGEVLPGSLPPLSEIWELAQQSLRGLPPVYRALKATTSYPVHYSEALQQLRRQAMQQVNDHPLP